MTKRVLIVVLAALVVAAVAAVQLRPERGAPEGAPTLAEMADGIGAQIMTHLHRGHVAGRSGEIMLVPKPHRYIVGEWDLTTLATDRPFMYTSHPNPWNYLSRIPLVFFGPSYFRSGVEVDDFVDLADIAPTFARILGFEGLEPDGEVLTEALKPKRGVRLPKVIFTVVIDGGGWNVLQEHPDSHPTIDRLRRAGTTYVNAVIGSAPSITGAIHGTLGTGVYPITHQIPGNQMRGEGGDPTIDTWLREADPRYLAAPTLSELWDEAHDNRPVVATVSYEGWHLGMIGHGAQRAGGDRDIAVLWKTEDDNWWINERYYELPPYLQTTDVARLERYEEQLDPRDGLRDGLWFGHPLEQLRTRKYRPGTPAFVRFTGDAAMDVLRREEIGTDRVTDFVWIEIKPPDFGGHEMNMEGPEQADTIREADRQIARFLKWLDRNVDRRDYAFALTADHGQQPLADTRGGWRINSYELERDIEDRFGPVVQRVTPVEIFMDLERMERDGIALEDVARYVGSYTIGENVPEGRPGAERVPDARRAETLFAGAFPTGFLTRLDESTIAAFGDSDYPEGDLTVDVTTDAGGGGN